MRKLIELTRFRLLGFQARDRAWTKAVDDGRYRRCLTVEEARQAFLAGWAARAIVRNGHPESVRLYEVLAISEKTGEITVVSGTYGLTHEEACTMALRFSPHKARRIQLRQL